MSDYGYTLITRWDCQNCGVEAESPHHKCGTMDDMPKGWRKYNGMALCPTCHGAVTEALKRTKAVRLGSAQVQA